MYNMPSVDQLCKFIEGLSDMERTAFEELFNILMDNYHGKITKAEKHDLSMKWSHWALWELHIPQGVIEDYLIPMTGKYCKRCVKEERKFAETQFYNQLLRALLEFKEDVRYLENDDGYSEAEQRWLEKVDKIWKTAANDKLPKSSALKRVKQITVLTGDEWQQLWLICSGEQVQDD
jgi:hypothetical protein